MTSSEVLEHIARTVVDIPYGTMRAKARAGEECAFEITITLDRDGFSAKSTIFIPQFSGDRDKTESTITSVVNTAVRMMDQQITEELEDEAKEHRPEWN